MVQQFKEAKVPNRPMIIMQSDILHFLAVMSVFVKWLEQRTRSHSPILLLACCMTWGKAFFTHARLKYSYLACHKITWSGTVEGHLQITQTQG